MTAVPLSTIRTRVRQLGNYENSARFTDPFLLDQINAALNELYEMISDVNEGYFDVTATLTTAIGVETVDLPADFWRMHGLDVNDGGNFIEMNQIGIQERNRYQLSNGTPRAFRIVAGGTRGSLVLYPTPGSVYSLRLLYEPTRTLLASDSDTVEDFNGWIDYVVTGALLRCDEREQRPIQERAAKLA